MQTKIRKRIESKDRNTVAQLQGHFLNVSVRSFGFLFVYDFHMWGGMAERRKPRPPLETVLKLILFLLKYQNHIILLQLGYSL